MNALIPRATINVIEANRNRALALYGEAFDALEEAREAALMATVSAIPASPFLAWDSHGYQSGSTRDKFMTRARQELDRAVWTHLLAATNLERLMDATAREAFRVQLREDPPEATADNCYATMSALIGDADLIFKRGIATAFSRLDRRFRSHDGFKVGARVVLSRAFQEFGGWNYRARQDETLRDIERTFLTLDGKPHPERGAGIVGRIDDRRLAVGGLTLKAFRVDDDYFDVRVWGNGNVHLWFKRDDLVERVNLLLAEYYGATLGVGADAAEVKHAPKTGMAKNFGFFETPPAVRDWVYETAGVAIPSHGHVVRPLRILEPSAGLGALAAAAARVGHKVTCVEVQPAHAKALAATGLFEYVRCMDFMSATPPSAGPRFDVVIMNPPFDQGRDIDHVVHAMQFLRPGGKLAAVMSAGVEFREDRKTADFRAMVERYGGRFHDLPAGSFAESGTMVNTVICEMRVPS